MADEDRTQCPFCFRSRRLKADGTMYSHTWGRNRKRCPGAGKTKIEALKLKGAPVPAQAELSSSGQPESPSGRTGLLEDDIPF